MLTGVISLLPALVVSNLDNILLKKQIWEENLYEHFMFVKLYHILYGYRTSRTKWIMFFGIALNMSEQNNLKNITPEYNEFIFYCMLF